MKILKECIITAWYGTITLYKMLLIWITETKIYNKIEDFFLEIKWFIQRGRRGWSDKDSWSIDWWLSKIIPPILIRLKKNKQGIPVSCFSSSKSRLKKNGDYTKAECKRAEKRWNKILTTMIDMFKIARHIQEDHWIYYPTKNYYTKENKDRRKRVGHLEFIHNMSYKECKLYEEGWKNFQEHFFSLWD